MDGMTELGHFGDERLQKGGPIFWRLSCLGARFACVSWEPTAPGRSGMGGFCTTLG